MLQDFVAHDVECIENRIHVKVTSDQQFMLWINPQNITSSRLPIRFLFLLIFSAPALAQDCSPINLELTTQAAVDNFQSTHGPCTRVGNLLVQGPDIINLDGLSGLTTVGTILRIVNNPGLASLTGLATLVSMSHLTIDGNSQLSSLDGLSGITTVDGLYIGNNRVLTNLDSLSSLSSALWLDISNNPALKNVAGLSSLATIGNNLTIFRNDSLTTLDGLSALTSVGLEANLVTDGGLSIIDNAALMNVDGLFALIQVRGSLWLEGNGALASLRGLSGLIHADGLTIRNNNALTDLDGLTELTGMVDGLFIVDNASLKHIDGLTSISGVGPNEGVRLSGNVSLQSLNGLTELANVAGDVLIHSNDALVGINGLSSLVSIGGELNLGGNDAMVHINGLSSLTSIGQKLQINYHAALTNLDGLLHLSSVGTDVYLQDNPSLYRCAALAKLVDSIDDDKPGPGPGGSGIPDVGDWLFIGGNEAGCNTRDEILADSRGILINQGMNDAWYNPLTDGQGFLITVFPDIKQMFVAWFTYEVKRPPDDVEALLGEPGHRWLTAQGPYAGDTATLSIYLTEGGVFDAADPPASNDGIADGTMILEFADCTEGLVTYEMTSPSISGEIPIQRISNDNVSLCNALVGQ
jgi:hypothetical protein